MVGGMIDVPWFDAWRATADRVKLPETTIARLRAAAAARESAREILVRFPPGCLVRLPTGAIGITTNIMDRPEGYYLGCLDDPSGRVVRYRPAEGAEPIAYLDVYTPALMRSILETDPANVN